MSPENWMQTRSSQTAFRCITVLENRSPTRHSSGAFPAAVWRRFASSVQLPSSSWPFYIHKTPPSIKQTTARDSPPLISYFIFFSSLFYSKTFFMPAYFSYSVSLYTDSVSIHRFSAKIGRCYSISTHYLSVTFINFQDTPRFFRAFQLLVVKYECLYRMPPPVEIFKEPCCNSAKLFAIARLDADRPIRFLPNLRRPASPRDHHGLRFLSFLPWSILHCV